MKRSLIFTILPALNLFLLHAPKAQTWNWATKGGGADYDYGYAISLDASGNCYTAGAFASTSIVFGSTTLNNASGMQTEDICIAKYNSSGAFQWAARAGGTEADIAYGISADASGNTYVVGYFASPTMVFGSTTLTNAGGVGLTNDVFIAKYNAAGAFQWAARAGGVDNDFGYGIALDGSGNPYMAGAFASASIVFGSTTLNNGVGGAEDIFLVKYNTAGAVQWAVKNGGNGSDIAYAVAVDGNGESYVTGYFQCNTITFGSSTLTNSSSIGYNDIFLAKYNSAGTVQWGVRAGGVGDFHDWSQGVSVDAGNNIYITGFFQGPSIIFGSTTLTNAGAGNTSDFFITQYNSSGVPQWSRRSGGTGWEYGWAISTDAGSGYTYVTGNYGSPSTVFGSTTLNNTGSFGTLDVFTVKYDASGNVICAISGGGSGGSDYSYGIDADASGNSYITGNYQGANPVFGSTTLSNSYDIFTASSSCALLPIEWLTFSGRPGKVNTLEWSTASESMNGYFTVERSSDGNTFEEIGQVHTAGNTSSMHRYGFTDNYPLPEINYYRLKQMDYDGRFSYSEIISLDNHFLADELILYPNPARESITAYYNYPTGKEISFTVFNACGEQVLKNQILLSRNSSEQQVNTGSLKPGMYFLRVEAGGEIFFRKFAAGTR